MDFTPERRRVRTNGITLDLAVAGPADGPPVVLLHGFPELSYGWRHQLPALAAAGHRVLAPDLRGYGGSDKPPGIGSYRIDSLAADVVGLVEAEGHSRAAIVGHDWGAAVGWWLAARHPDVVERLVAINVPHPLVMTRFLRRSPAQWLRSLYILFFQLPRLPEWFLARRDHRALVRALRETSRPGTFGDGDLAVYREAWSRPGALTAMLGWYRAAARRRSPVPDPARVTVPTLVIWGARDQFLDRRMAPASVALCDDGRLALIEEATHWVHLEEPARVNALVTDFLLGAR